MHEKVNIQGMRCSEHAAGEQQVACAHKPQRTLQQVLLFWHPAWAESCNSALLPASELRSPTTHLCAYTMLDGASV